MISVKKKEDVFFVLFNEYIAKIKITAATFDDFINNYNQNSDKTAVLKQLETECDGVTHKILQTLNAAFVTPFDREDIYSIAKGVDDIADIMEETANRLEIFNVQNIRPEVYKINELIMSSVDELVKLFACLHDFKKSAAIKDLIIEVNRLENEGDIVYRAALSRLFREEKDPIEIIKWKHIFELLEECLDACEDVANIIEGVVMKNV